MNIITLGPRTLPFSVSIGLEEVVPFAACSPPGSLALQEAKRQCDQLTVDWSLWTMRKRQPHVPAEADFLRYFVIVIKWRHSCLRTHKHRLSERCKGTVASARLLSFSGMSNSFHMFKFTHLSSPGIWRWHNFCAKPTSWVCLVIHLRKLRVLAPEPELLFFKRLKDSGGQTSPKAILFSFQFIRSARDNIWKSNFVFYFHWRFSLFLFIISLEEFKPREG